jgi:hypothetical protein
LQFLYDSCFFLNSWLILVIRINPLYTSIQLSHFVTAIFLLRILHKIRKKVKDKCEKKIRWVHITYIKKRKMLNTKWQNCSKRLDLVFVKKIL